MNKAFTANINDQVTARGYLDENDQLIMLEPEGSGGGGGDFTIANVEIKGSNIQTGLDVGVLLPIVVDGGLSTTTVATGLFVGDPPVKVPLYKGKCVCVITDENVASVTVESGDSEVDGRHVLIKGDCVLVFTANQ